MIRPYLRDLINDHKTPDEVNDYDHDTERGEWKIQLVMQNSCISTTNFEETCTIYSGSEPVEICKGSHTEDVIDTLLIQFYKDFNKCKKHQMIKEANLFLKVLNYYVIIFKK